MRFGKLIFSLITLLVTGSAVACVIPMTGPNFDQHIVVEKIGRNKFKAVVSKNAEGLEYGAGASVEYYPVDSEHRFGEYSKEIPLVVQGESYVSVFELKKIEGHIPYVQVNWYPKKCCSCGAYGKSEDLKLE